MYFIAEGEVEVDIEPDARSARSTAPSSANSRLLGNSVRTANVSTTKQSTLLVLDLADFRTLTAHHPELAHAIEDEAERRSGDIRRRRELQDAASK